jgi:hypothetical protein
MPKTTITYLAPEATSGKAVEEELDGSSVSKEPYGLVITSGGQRRTIPWGRVLLVVEEVADRSVYEDRGLEVL